MNFINPGFLFALFALAIPVIIHLFNFRKFKKVYFSNVQFLQELKEQNSSRENLKNILILIFRLLAITMLVFAFARPYFASEQNTAPGAATAVRMYVDNSYSMETVNKEGSLLENAKRSALSIANGFDRNTRFMLVTNDFEGRHQRLLDREEFKKAVEEIKVSSAERNLQQVINRQNAAKDPGVLYNYVISDFQKNFVGTIPILADTNAHTLLVKLNANPLPNISVDSVWFLSPIHQPHSSENLVVRLKNFGGEDAQNIPLKLDIDGTQKAVRSVNIPARKSKTDTLAFSGLEPGWKKGTVSIKDYPLTFDDQLRFSFKVNHGIKILAINGLQSENYLRILFGTDDFFTLQEMPEQNINYTAFTDYKLIILNGLQNPSSGLIKQLSLYLENGGSVVVFPDVNADKNAFSNMLNQLGLPSVSALVTEETKVSAIDFKNPLFRDLFEELPKNPDFPTVSRFYTFGTGKASAEVLMQLQANRPFLSKYLSESGNVYLFAAGLDSKVSNLPRHPIFVPLLLKIAFSSLREQRLYYVVGKDNALETQRVALGVNQSLKLMSDNFEAIPELSQRNGTSQLYIADQVRSAGFYDLIKADSTIGVYAFNNAGAESDMVYAAPGEIKELFGKEQPLSFYDARKDALPSGELIHAGGKELWKICLVLAAVFLAIEILLIRFFNSTKILKAI